MPARDPDSGRAESADTVQQPPRVAPDSNPDPATSGPGLGAAATVAYVGAAPTFAASSEVQSGAATRPGGVRDARVRRTDDATDANPADVLDAGRYTLGALLGRGGMGEVVLAYDQNIGRDVAVKRIRGDVMSPELLSRFVREARVQGRLEHPAVVPVHDLAFDSTGRPYFVMKRLTGTTMSDVLARLGEQSSVEADTTRRRLLRAFADVCLAIEFAHLAGIIHRDLKPANIMLGDFGEVYVLDWGVARALTDPEEAGAKPAQRDLELDSGATSAGTVLGTPSYMAPEQLAGDPAGPAADTYALGCVLYEIAAGEMLHGGRRSLTAVLRPLDARPSSVRPDSAPELDAICARATALDPEARFESARALGDAVQAFLDGDRDLAVRVELAQHHLGLARAAFARGDDATHRREAMQAAGRALALDPTAVEAATLVTRLMLEPPTVAPPEVEEQIARLDHAAARTQGRLAAASMLGYLVFIPLLMWTGVRSYSLVIAFAAIAMASGVQVWRLTHRTEIVRTGIYFNACLNAVLIGLVCRMVGPFIITPTLVITTLIAYAAHPALGSIRVVAVLLSSGVVVPWLLEVIGVLSPTYHFVRGELVLSSPVLTFTSVPVQVAFAVLLVALLAVVALLTRGMAVRQRAAARALELQAWHLRQILPTPHR